MQTQTTTLSVTDLERAVDDGRPVHAADGRLGTADTLYYDRVDGRPRWLAVRDPDRRLLLLPVDGLRGDADGLTAPFTRTLVFDAPPAAGSDIDAETERRLAQHYRLGHGGGAAAADAPLHREGWEHAPRPAAYRPAAPGPRRRDDRRDERRPFWLTSEFVLLVLGVAAMFVASSTDPDELPHQRCWVIATIMSAVLYQLSYVGLA